MTPEASGLIDAKIVIDWSPEQISGWLRSEKGLLISYERIYQHIWTDKRGQIRKGAIQTDVE